MNEQELRDELKFFYENFDEIGISIYAIHKDSNDPVKLDIESDALAGLKSLFIDSIKKTITDRKEISILNLSASDERTDSIYLYDIDIPDELACINNVIARDNLPLMDLSNTSLSNIQALLIEIGDNVGQIILYKTMAPINIYNQKNFFLKKTKTRLTRIDDEFLRVSDNFQLIKIKDSLFVIDLNALEKNFGFREVIKREAKHGIKAIETMYIVENTDVLYDLIEDVRYARKLTKIAKASPVIEAKVPNENIINFCKFFPKLKGKIRFNNLEDRIFLDTKISKDLFIKVLMDDFLTSELTKFHYESVAKDSLDEYREKVTETQE